MADETPEINVKNFDDHAKGTVFQRNLGRDVIDEPLVIKSENAHVLVHENSGALGPLRGEGEGELKWYSDAAFKDKYGEVGEIRTFEQYQDDSDVLRKTPGLGRNLAENSDFMKLRVEEVKQDMIDAKEVFGPSVPKGDLNLDVAPE